MAVVIPQVSSMLITRSRFMILIALFTLLSSVYMLFYTADSWEFGDPPYLFNMTASLVRYQDTLFDLMAFNHPDRPDNSFYPDRLYPLYTYPEDMLSIVLATPLYWLAYHLPGIGLVHTVWLLNIFVCAATACVFFIYALALGYDERTAVLAALTLAVATIILPYSRSFMQEPTAMLVTLLLALTLERWRAGEFRSHRLLILALILALFMFLAKRTALAGLPGLFIIALRAPKPKFRYLQVQAASFIGIGLLALLLAFVDLKAVFAPFASLFREFKSSHLMIAIRAYLFSVTASLWAASPPVLLAIPGFWLLYRRRQTRYLWVMLVLALGYMVGYAIFHNAHWYGSVTWPVRYFLPVIPFLLIVALPIFDRLAHWQATRLMTICFGVLVVYALWINFNGVSYRWDTYDKLLPAGLNMTQGDAAFNPAWMPWVLLPKLWGEKPFIFAWVRTGQTVFPVMFALLAAACVGVLGFILRRYTLKRGLLLIASLPIAFVICVYIGLRMIYIDPLYWGQNDDLRRMLLIIEQETQPPDMVFVTSSDHVFFLFNYGKIDHARLVGLTFQPGERYSPEQDPLVSDTYDYNQLLTNTTLPMLRAAAQKRDSLWLLADFGPFHPWAVRPVEQFLVSEYYLIREIDTAPAVRLLQYATGRAERDVTPLEVSTGYVFGGNFRLDDVYLPLGTTYTAGQTLPIGLTWRALETPGRDYTIAFFLADSENAVVAQGMDSAPNGGFAPTAQWPVDFTLRDNRGLILPDTLPTGEYQLWLRLYHRFDDGTLELLPLEGKNVYEDTIAVLPIVISVEN